MTLKDEARKDLIKYRLEQARDTISVVEMLIKNKELPTAVNRIYYGMFYSLLALGLKYQFETSKHQQLLGWFNKNFIHTNKIEVRFGKILRNAYKNRRKGDYETFVEFNIEDVKLMFNEMKEFIEEMDRFIFEKDVNNSSFAVKK